MKITFETECGEKTCAAKPRQFCRFFGSKNFGQDAWCMWFNCEIRDKDGWVQRCQQCLDTFKGK